MTTLLDNLIKKADMNDGYASCGNFSTVILNNIEIGTKEPYYCYKEENRPRRIEVWLHLNRAITANDSEEFQCIIQNNDIPEDEIKCGELYDYHLPFLSVAWLADIFPALLSTKMEQWVDQDPTEKLVECALTSGCDVLDMTTMTIHRCE